MRPWILLLFIMTSLCRAAILHVPADYPAIQPAMDASAPGDTVHVTRGVWSGLYTSPTHSLTLCSDYLFSQDSTDINVTILDGEYAGTILDIIVGEGNWFTLCGFTLQHGQGQDISPFAYCFRGGALQINTPSNAEIKDTVFRENRAPRGGAVLNQGIVCGVGPFAGSLFLRNVACYNNTTDAPTGGVTGVLFIRTSASTMVIDKFLYNGGGDSSRSIYVYCSLMDSVYVNDLTLLDCDGNGGSIGSSIVHESGQVFTNIRTSAADGLRGSGFGIQANHNDVESSVAVVRNIDFGDQRLALSSSIRSQSTTLDIDGVKIHGFRSTGDESVVQIRSDVPGSLRNVNIYNNTAGDSLTHIAKSLLRTVNMNLDSVYVHDNRSIVPGDPQVASNGGNDVQGAMVRAEGQNITLSNMRFENNRVDDLDDYSDHSPSEIPHTNWGRELWAGANGILVARNISVEHSRQPNSVPEVYSVADIDQSRPGSTLVFVAGTHLYLDSIRVEDADDGGLVVGSDSIWVSNVVLKDVGRVGFLMGRNELPQAAPYYSFRNIHIENVDASDNFLTPQEQWGSNQALLFVDVRAAYFGIPPTIEFENVTATGCDGMRHLFNFYEGVTLRVRNCVFWNNTYQQLLEWDDPITQTWEYNILQEPVPGIGNQVGVDPLFDEELGIPWLSAISPAIDAGHTDESYNDIEDPDNPGFARWPSQGTTRNDIGYTGGPHAGTLEHLVAVRAPRTEPQAHPSSFELLPAFPNPFNPVTTLGYVLNRPLQVELSVYNVLGQKVRTLTSGLESPGVHHVLFEAGELASGVYIVKLNAGGESRTQKILLLK